MIQSGVQILAPSALESQTRGEIDIQVRTAKAYPRSIKVFYDTALQTATLNEAEAERHVEGPATGKKK